LKDPNVKAILVNIFAGINRCDWIATGVVQATRDQDVDVPVIVRLAGTNVAEGRAILDESGLELIQAVDLDDAAAKAVAAVAAQIEGAAARDAEEAVAATAPRGGQS
jgi:malate-CoA ligase subunit beta